MFGIQMDFGRLIAHIKFSHSIVTRFTTNIFTTKDMSPTSNTLHWILENPYLIPKKLELRVCLDGGKGEGRGGIHLY